MAAVQRFVDTGADGTGDGTTNATSGASSAYASLSSFNANETGNAADDFTVDCAASDTGSGNLPDTTGVILNLASNTMLVRPDAANENNGVAFIDPDKYRMIVAGLCILPDTSNITLRGLQIDCTDTGGFVSAIRLNSGVLSGLVVEKCRIRAAGRSCIGCNNSNPDSGGAGISTFRNNVLVLTGGSYAFDVSFSSPTSADLTVHVYQNTIYSNSTKPGIRFSGFTGTGVQTLNVKNNVVANTSAPFSLLADTGSLTTVTDYNWTDAGTAGTTNEQNLPAAPFTSAGTTFAADFSLTEALATGGAVGSITTDITGATRGTPPDAGAYEFADVGGGGFQSAWARGSNIVLQPGF